MESEFKLTTGVCKQICDPDVQSSTLFSLIALKPVVQVVQVKKATVKPSQKINGDVWTIYISDGVHFVAAVLKKELGVLVHEKKVIKNVVIQINSYTRKVERR